FADQALFLANRTMLIFREQGVDLVPHRSVDDPRSDCVDIDAVLDQFEGEALRQADDRRLGRTIDGDARLASPPRLARKVYDLASLAGGDHELRDGLRHEQEAAHV